MSDQECKKCNQCGGCQQPTKWVIEKTCRPGYEEQYEEFKRKQDEQVRETAAIVIRLIKEETLFWSQFTKMKYLKLILDKPLPDNGHITFAYFGKVKVENPTSTVHHALAAIQPFTLTYVRDDLFGPNNDQPVRVDECPPDIDVLIQQGRQALLKATGVEDQNRPQWNPHVTNPSPAYNELTTLHVIGVEANDGSFTHLF